MEIRKPLDILFINPPSAFEAYGGTKVRVFKQVFPLLSFMSLSASLRQGGFTTAVLDLGIENKPYNLLRKKLAELQPRFVGITATTPLFFEVVEISRITRAVLGAKVKIVCGGPHVTALPEESLRQSEVDVVMLGESELTLKELAEGKNLAEINGIYYKKEGAILSTPLRQFIDNLDLLPLPDLDVYDIQRYHCSELVSKGTPVLHMETSRGCPYSCKFCNKNIFERKFRVKSPERVIEEMKYFIRKGAGEFRIIDDQFATDIERAKRICELMIKEKINVSWNLGNGIRVDRADQEFLNLAKRAGCYQIGIGFESGDQDSLNSINKGITLEQSIKCMEMVKRSGLESIGFFMIGLPADTEERIEKTIKFACKLMPTFAKATILIPFPGTQIFEEWEKQGRIKTRDWSKYNIHKVADIYEHPNLTQKRLRKYYNLFYRRFYFNPRFITMRVSKSLRERTFWRDIFYGLKTFLPDFTMASRLKKENNQTEEILEVNSTFLDKLLCRLRTNQAIKYIENGDVILDAGCGDKPYLYYHLKRAKKREIKYFGIDQSVKSRNDADLKILVHDFTKPGALPFDDFYFDKIVLLAVIEHLENIEQICKEFHRVLKDNGLLIVTTPTRRARKIWEFLTKLRVINPLGLDDHKKYYEGEEIVKVLIQAGFEREKIKVSEFEFGYNMLVVARK